MYQDADLWMTGLGSVRSLPAVLSMVRQKHRLDRHGQAWYEK